MNKTLDLSKTVYELCTNDPSITEIMRDLGFDQLSNPVMLATAGKVMTIPKGARIRKIDLSFIINTFEQAGYTVLGKETTSHE